MTEKLVDENSGLKSGWRGNGRRCIKGEEKRDVRSDME
jgi:hypothetical protein